jgi:methionyl-tRNA formyltransferase
MSREPLSRAGANQIASAACVLFAYHEIGYACMAELLALDAPIAALYTHADTPGEEIWWRSCTDLAARHRIPIRMAEKIDAAELAAIRACDPAIIYSFYYRNLLPEETLNLAPCGAYNLHGSMLPKYRGRAPVNWMILNGETEGGVTLHHMVARADAGDVVAQRAVPITGEDTAVSLYRKLAPAAAALIREYHPLIVAGTAPRQRQDLQAGSYFGRRRPDDGRIDWSWPARRIYNLIRAVTHPYPGAFCLIEGRKLRIWGARVASETDRPAAPGTIIGSDPAGGLNIATGAGTLIISEVQLDAGNEGRAAEVLAPVVQRAGVRCQ